MEQRRWIICYDASKPIEALAIGIIAMQSECSLIFAKAIFFDTQLDSQKKEEWFKEVSRALTRPFDQQKSARIRSAVNQIVAQLSTGQSAIRVEEL